MFAYKSDFFQLYEYLNLKITNITNNTYFSITNIFDAAFSFPDYKNEEKKYSSTNDEIAHKKNKNITEKVNKNEKNEIQNNNNKKQNLLNVEINDNGKNIKNIKIFLKLNILNKYIYISRKPTNKFFNIEKKYLNKKRKNPFEVEKNIYIPDSYLKQIRSMILDSLIDFINNKIKKFKNNKISAGICKMQFKPINKEKLYHSKVDDDKQFLDLKLNEILSWDLNKKYTNNLNDANSQLVQDLISDENGQYFIELFDMTFLECLDCIRGNENSNSFLFDGFPTIEEIITNKKNKINKKDIQKYIYYINNYEISLMSKKSRLSKTIKKK